MEPGSKALLEESGGSGRHFGFNTGKSIHFMELLHTISHTMKAIHERTALYVLLLQWVGRFPLESSLSLSQTELHVFFTSQMAKS